MLRCTYIASLVFFLNCTEHLVHSVWKTRFCDRLHHLCRILLLLSLEYFFFRSLINRGWINADYLNVVWCAVALYLRCLLTIRDWLRERVNRGTKSAITAFLSSGSRHDGILQETWTCHRKKTCRHRSFRVQNVFGDASSKWSASFVAGPGCE